MNVATLNGATLNGRPASRSAAPAPASLAQAIAARWTTRGLDAPVGPLFEGRSFASEPPPNGFVTIERGGIALATSTGTVIDYIGRFRVRALTGQGAHDAAVLVAAAFDAAGLRWTGGFARGGIQEGWASGDEKDFGGGAVLAFYEEITYRWRVRGPR